MLTHEIIHAEVFFINIKIIEMYRGWDHKVLKLINLYLYLVSQTVALLVIDMRMPRLQNFM